MPLSVTPTSDRGYPAWCDNSLVLCAATYDHVGAPHFAYTYPFRHVAAPHTARKPQSQGQPQVTQRATYTPQRRPANKHGCALKKRSERPSSGTAAPHDSVSHPRGLAPLLLISRRGLGFTGGLGFINPRLYSQTARLWFQNHLGHETRARRDLAPPAPV